MKLSVASLGKLLLINLCLVAQSNHGVSAEKIELLSLLPNTFRKAKRGLGKLLQHWTPTPPVAVIPHRTGITSLDRAVFQSLLVGNTMKVSLANQINAMVINKSVLPNLFMLLMSIIPVNQWASAVSMNSMEHKAMAQDGILYLQMIVRGVLSSQLLQILSVTVRDAVMNHAAIVHPTLKTAMELVPKAIPKIAILGLVVHSMMKFIYSVLVPLYKKKSSSLSVNVTPIFTDDNVVMATFSPINFAEDDSVVTDIASDAQFTTMPVHTESTAIEVNVTKISAVLDRFESKILSLVGGTRFHPTPLQSEDDGIEEEEETATIAVVLENHENTIPEPDCTPFTTTMYDNVEMTEVSETVDIVSENADADSEVSTSTDENNGVEESFPSLKSYVISLSSPHSVWETMTSPSSKAAIRAIGVIACALSSVHVLPSFARNTIAVFAGLFLLGMLVQEIRVGFSKRGNDDTLRSLIHGIDARTHLYTNRMEPLVVESRQEEIEPTSVAQSSFRFWRTRLPILDGIASVSSHLVTSQDDSIDEAISVLNTTEVEDNSLVASPQIESAIHYYKESDQDITLKHPASQPSNVWRWMTHASSKPKITRTACTAIVGM